MVFSLTHHTIAQKKLISEPNENWKDALEDLKNHASCKYHNNSMAKMWTYENYAYRIDLTIAEKSSRTFHEVLRSLLKCLEFCGRQGIALRGHRDDDTSTSFNKGNFKALLRVDAGDKGLEHHLVSCARSATYTSKKTQYVLLLCVKEFLQSKIVQEIKEQMIG